jgi:tyrosine-protein phosphatase SIW14
MARLVASEPSVRVQYRTPGRSRRSVLVWAAVAAAAAGSASAWLVRRTALPKRFAVVSEGVLYRSAQPSPRQIDNAVHRYAVRTLLIVREGDSGRVEREIRHAAAAGLRVVHLPVPSGGEVSDEHVAQFWRTVDDPANQPVLIHCAAGRHRTGFFCALYRVARQGWSPERARDEMLSFGFDRQRHATLLGQFERVMQTWPAAAGAAHGPRPARTR